MKIAVLGDAHGNATAMRAVVEDVDRWSPDIVVSLGDMINRGPSPATCLDMVTRREREAGWRLLLGNHEEYVIHQSTPEAARNGPEFECFYQSYWTYRKIGEDVGAIRSWAGSLDLRGPDQTVVRCAHASVLGTRRGIFPGSSDEDLVNRAGQPAPDLFVAGHTHTAFIRRVGKILFVNAGSVGIPFDGDGRAAYARLTWRESGWDAEVMRVDYDRESTLQEYRESGYLEEAGPVAWLVLAEYLFSTSQLYLWHRDYFEPVMKGERDVESTVREQLEKQGMWEAVRPYL